MLRYTTVADVSDLKHDDLASMHNCINTQVRFRALLADGGAERLELSRT